MLSGGPTYNGDLPGFMANSILRLDSIISSTLLDAAELRCCNDYPFYISAPSGSFNEFDTMMSKVYVFYKSTVYNYSNVSMQLLA